MPTFLFQIISRSLSQQPTVAEPYSRKVINWWNVSIIPIYIKSGTHTTLSQGSSSARFDLRHFQIEIDSLGWTDNSQRINVSYFVNVERRELKFSLVTIWICLKQMAKQKRTWKILQSHHFVTGRGVWDSLNELELYAIFRPSHTIIMHTICTVMCQITARPASSTWKVHVSHYSNKK